MGNTKDKIVKNFNLEIKEASGVEELDGEINVFEIRGTANSGLKDRWGERMPKSCWNLENYLKNPLLLRDHEFKSPIGRITEIYAEETGLKFVAYIGKKGVGLTDLQKETILLIEQDVLKTFSVGFINHEYDYDAKTDTITYVNAELYEISLVAVPMDANALMGSYGYKSFVHKNNIGGCNMGDKTLNEINENIKAFKKIIENEYDEKVKRLNSEKENLDNEIKKLKGDIDTLVTEKKELVEKNETLESLVEQLNELVV